MPWQGSYKTVRILDAFPDEFPICVSWSKEPIVSAGLSYGWTVAAFLIAISALLILSMFAVRFDNRLSDEIGRLIRHSISALFCFFCVTQLFLPTYGLPMPLLGDGSYIIFLLSVYFLLPAITPLKRHLFGEWRLTIREGGIIFPRKFRKLHVTDWICCQSDDTTWFTLLPQNSIGSSVSYYDKTNTLCKSNYAGFATAEYGYVNASGNLDEVNFFDEEHKPCNYIVLGFASVQAVGWSDSLF